MRNDVRDWVQEGQLLVWRYASPKSGWRGWHLAGDPTGCRSIRNLFDAMHGGGACHRTLRLEPVTEAILSVPNYAQKTEGRFRKLRLDYRPGCAGLFLSPEDDILVMTVGPRRLRSLTAAFAQVEIGGGDFGIPTSDDKRAEHWMFWWMPDINYHLGKRL